MDEHTVIRLLFYYNGGLIFVLLLFSLNWMIVNLVRACYFPHVPLNAGLATIASNVDFDVTRSPRSDEFEYYAGHGGV
jgi:hypothetical protein